MTMQNSESVITVKTTVKAPVRHVWNCWIQPDHITQWNFASDDWHAPSAINDLRPGGHFVFRMEARDGSMGFDFEGEYDSVQPLESISYRIADGRKVNIRFESDGNETHVFETFEPESVNPAELQRGGWQAILDNFKNYTESQVEFQS